MDRDYAQPLDVPTLAAVALMSPGHFSRSFRAAFGETPYSYLMTRRVERAKALLRRGDLSVTEVCFAVGCTSLGSCRRRGTAAGVVAPYHPARPRRRRRRFAQVPCPQPASAAPGSRRDPLPVRRDDRPNHCPARGDQSAPTPESSSS